MGFQEQMIQRSRRRRPRLSSKMTTKSATLYASSSSSSRRRRVCSTRQLQSTNRPHRHPPRPFLAGRGVVTIPLRLLVLLLLLLRPTPTTAQIGVCDAENDSCPTPFDGVCDSGLVPSCANGDCFDCDLCRGFDYDCTGCISNGCYWCPGDGTCIGNLYTFTKIASCVAESDYVTDTCDNVNNFFRYVG